MTDSLLINYCSIAVRSRASFASAGQVALVRKTYILLYKVGWNRCSQKPSASQCLCPAAAIKISVRQECHPRSAGGWSAGQDTTGLLLLNDDGQFIHGMTSQKHVPKVYRVTKNTRGCSSNSKLLEGVVWMMTNN